MTETKYYITINNKTVADNCDINIAMLLVKAIFEEYYNETDMVVAVAKSETVVCKKYVPHCDDDWSDSNDN